MRFGPDRPDPDADVRRGTGHTIGGSAIVVLVGGLVALLVVTDFVNRWQTGGDAFVTPTQLSTTALYAAVLGLISAGQTLVMWSGGIDLSVTATAAASAVVVAGTGVHGAAPAILAALGIGLGLGTVNGIGVAILRVNPVLMTLGFATVTLAALPIYRAEHPGEAVPELARTLGAERFGTYVPYDLLVWAPVAVLVVVGLRRAGVGRAIARSPRPGEPGVPARRAITVQLLVYSASGLLAAGAGVLLAGLNNAADLGIATPLLLPSIAAVMIGGTSGFGRTGGYAGTIVGVLMLTVLDSLLSIVGAAPGVRQIVYASIVLVLAASFARLGGRDLRGGATEIGSRS